MKEEAECLYTYGIAHVNGSHAGYTINIKLYIFIKN